MSELLSVADLDAELARLPPGGLLLGYSGGLDSTVLLHLLAQSTVARARGPRALHINHGLQASASDWASFCAAQARQFEIPFLCIEVDVDRRQGLGLEGAARQARYAAFEQAMAADEILLLAHHRDDQVETVLLRLLRQAGSAALAGMARWRRHAQGWLWRPLLDQPRSVLEGYARAHDLQWIEDPSNCDESLDRNYLRHRVLPLLRQRWPQAERAIAGSAAHLADDAAWRDQQVQQLLAAARGLDPKTLLLAALRPLTPAQRGHVLRAFVAARSLPAPPLSLLQRLSQHLDALDAAAQTEFELGWADLRLRRYRDLLHLDRRFTPWPGPARPWDGCQPLLLPDGGELALEPAAERAEDWQVSPRAGGERIQLPGREHSSELKRVLQGLGVPPWEREQLPLLWSAQGALLAAGDLVISAAMERWLHSHQSRLRWTPASEKPAAEGQDR